VTGRSESNVTFSTRQVGLWTLTWRGVPPSTAVSAAGRERTSVRIRVRVSKRFDSITRLCSVTSEGQECCVHTMGRDGYPVYGEYQPSDRRAISVRMRRDSVGARIAGSITPNGALQSHGRSRVLSTWNRCSPAIWPWRRFTFDGSRDARRPGAVSSA
jgi:hypothetical protein